MITTDNKRRSTRISGPAPSDTHLDICVATAAKARKSVNLTGKARTLNLKREYPSEINDSEYGKLHEVQQTLQRAADLHAKALSKTEGTSVKQRADVRLPTAASAAHRPYTYANYFDVLEFMDEVGSIRLPLLLKVHGLHVFGRHSAAIPRRVCSCA